MKGLVCEEWSSVLGMFSLEDGRMRAEHCLRILRGLDRVDVARMFPTDEDSSDDEAIQLVINSGKEEINEQFFHQVRVEEKERLQNERDEIKVVASRVRGQLKGESDTSRGFQLRTSLLRLGNSQQSFKSLLFLWLGFADEDFMEGRWKRAETTGEEDPFSVAARTRCTQHNVLTREFVDVMNLCHSEQSEYRNRNVERIHRQLKITGHQLSEEELEMMLETGKQDIFTANILQDTQFTRQALNEMESRHTEILRLEKSISELHDMFMYLAFEVEAQGEMINNIENTVVSTVNYVEKAAVNTASAANSQRKALKKKICIIVCISLLLVVIISIILTVSLI
ncbi:syntaxin-4-like [Narcine bancroftii]|uniref:syntaxin-4-like n=1 Tax=Narcine bancroftii TaxID=1343680 RepID=UPI0038311E79